MKKNILPFRALALYCILLAICCIAPQKANAQQHTDWPFDGSEFKITALYANFVRLQIPIYDEVGNDRYYSNKSHILGPNSNAGAVIEYNITGGENDWVPFMALFSSDSDGSTQTTSDNWNTVKAWVFGDNHVVTAHPLCTQFGSRKDINNIVLMQNSQTFGYYNVAYPENKDSRTFAAFDWHFDKTIPYGNVIRLRMRAQIRMKGAQNQYSQEQTWYISRRIVTGNPMSEPVVAATTASSFGDGFINFEVNIPGFNAFKDVSPNFPELTLLRISGVPFTPQPGGITLTTTTGAGPYTFKQRVSKDDLNKGVTVKATIDRRDWANAYPPTLSGPPSQNCNLEWTWGVRDRSSAPRTSLKYPQPTGLNASFANGDVTLQWNMVAGTAESPTDGYQFWWKRAGGEWAPIEINKAYNFKNLQETVSFPLESLPGVVGSGNNVTLHFIVGRAGINFETKGRDNLPFYDECFKKNINTNNLGFESTSATANQADRSISLEIVVDKGYSQPNWTLRVERREDGVVKRTWENLPLKVTTTVLDKAVTGEDPVPGPTPCTPIYYKVQIRDGANAIIVEKNSNEAMLDLNESEFGKIKNLTASKGFYNDKILIRWNIEGSDFQKYTIHRKNISSPNQPEQFVTEFASSGLSTYSFEDNVALAGKVYTYTVKGYVNCQGNIYAGDVKDVNGYMQPMGMASGRVTYQGSNAAMPNANIIAEYVPDGEGDEFENKAFAGTDDLMVMIPSLNPLQPGGCTRCGEVSTINSSAQLWYKHTRNNPQGGSMIWKITQNMLAYDSDMGRLSLFFINPLGGWTSLNFDYELPLNEYVHITTTLSANPSQVVATLYINGIDTVRHEVAPSTLVTMDIWSTILLGLAASSIGGIAYAVNIEDDPTNFAATTGAYIDEFRFWNKTLSKAEVENNFDRFITGREEGLFIYYRFDEPGGREIFDISGRNQVFNENHGYILRSSGGVAMEYRCTQNVPTPQQLAIRGLTDAQGNYTINSIPYGEYGSSYRIKPLSSGIFAPENIPFIFSQASPIANNMNFVNESVHEVTGTVVYRGGNYPVAGCHFEVDGMIANINGVPIISDGDGIFSIPVPVGVRRVQVKKTGHLFEDDGFLLDPVTKTHINYIKDEHNIIFIDTTLVKVIGHVVGGKLEHDKVSGHGLRKNNIGSEFVELEIEKNSYLLSCDEDYNHTSITQTFLHHDCRLNKWKDIIEDYKDTLNILPQRTVLKDTTTMTITGPKIIIEVSKHTGEFVAWLPPERYTVSPIKAGEGTNTYNVTTNNRILDLINSVVITKDMYKTSILKWERNDWQYDTTGPGYYQLTEHADTVYYNAEFGDFYQPRPTFTVKQVAGSMGAEVNYYGEKMFKVNDLGTPIDLAPGIGNNQNTYNILNGDGYLLKNAVYVQGTSYMFNLKASEQYYNPFSLTGETVPIVGGTVSFVGDLLKESPAPSIILDENGEGKFRLVPGDPDLTTGKKSFNALLYIAGRPFYINGIESAGINAILLGGASTGSNFLTAAGDDIDLILHDPPGSNSYAYIEQGTALSTVKTYNRSHEENIVETVKLIMGGETISLAGLGAMLGGRIEAIMDKNEFSTKWETNIDDETTISTVRFNSTLKTSASTDYVGHMGDIFVGTGVNTIYGKIFSIDIVPNNKVIPTMHTHMIPQITIGDYSIVRSLGFAFGPTFQTSYYFTTHDIENIMIPKWKEVKEFMLKDGYSSAWVHDDLNNLNALDNLTNPGQTYGNNIDSLKAPVYVSKVPPTHVLFGTKNCDERWDDPVYNPDYPTIKSVAGTNGPSYKRILDKKTAQAVKDASNPVPIDLTISGEAVNATGTIEFTDSIVYYNEQIEKWIEHLALNEERKVRMIDQYESGNNISFGGGATVGKSVTAEISESWTKSKIKHKHNFINERGGYVFYGFGVETHKAGNEWINVTNEHGETTENYFTTGFVLDEFGLNDQISVDYQLSDWEVDIPTFVFRTRGGQTSCPYEDKVVTQYYPPPSGGTIIMEQTMKVEDPKIQVVQPIQNDVPASLPAVFTLSLSNESPVYASGWFVLKYDDLKTPAGATLKIDGLPIGNGRFFNIPAFTPMVKTLYLEKGEDDHYVDIPLILSSVCDPSQFDVTHITAHFTPACTSVEMTDPPQNWIVNIASKGEIEIVLKNHNPNYKDFGYIELQERRVGTPTWTELRRFYYDTLRWAAVSGNPDLNGTGPWKLPTINYTWKVHNKPDAEYEFRAKSVCESFNPAGGTTSLISEFYTEPVRGIVDMNPPRVMGVSPANGILGAGDEISITFNEDIQGGMLNQYNFTISGILNDSEFSIPTTGLNFSGEQSAQTQMNVFTNGSFSIETWFNRKLNTAGTLFAYGQGNNFLSLEFDIEGMAILRLGGNSYPQEVTTLNPTINNLDVEVWRYVGLGYNRETNQVTVSMFTMGDTPSPYFMFQNQQLIDKPETQGILIVGNNHTGTNGFKGAIAHTHFYAKFRDRNHITGTLNLVKSGREDGIIGYWMMDEGEGNVAKDKVRGRNIFAQNANWYNYPIGYALKTGNENPFSIKTSSYSFDAQSDFTIEFWFRSDGTTQAGQTLMSGRRAYLAVNAEGGLILHKPTLDGSQGDTISIITNTNLMNETWHHFAMAVRRNAMVNVFINGETAAVFDEKLFGTFATADLSFGAKFTFQNEEQEVPLTSHFFPGLFDEIRIWNSALSKETVKENRNNKLHGNEAGLQAYYPLEKYNKASNGIISTISYRQNLSLDEYLPDNQTLAATGGTLVQDGAPVNDIKPIEQVPLTFVASNNKIVLNMAQSHFARVEGVTLNIAVRNIRDLRGNLSAVETWTAFVRRNQLRWDEDPINIVMEEGKTVTFTARIINMGGTAVNYIVPSDLPSWLTVTPNAGTLPPMGNKTLTFTINNAINVGNYEHNIGLSSGNGVVEQLPLQLKVRKQKPDWEVNPNDFEVSMNLMGRITIKELFSEDPEDLLGAFIEDLCVGVASPEYNGGMGAYYVFATVYGNSIHVNKPITFKVWEAATGEIFPAVQTSIGETVQNFKFVPNSVHGSPAQPVIFKALSGIRQQQIALKTGWNMISTNVTYDDPEILEQMKISLMDVGVQIKGIDGFIQQMVNQWFGTLTEISEKSMYYIQTTDNHTLSLTGYPASPLHTLIPLKQNWNYIGYTPNVNLPVMMAMGEANPKHGDIMKDQTSFTTYYEPNTGNAAWIGNLTHLFPGRGYLYFSTDSTQKTFFYPDDTFRGEAYDYEPIVPLKWEPNPQNYEASMSLLAIVADGDREMRSELFEIAAFNGETCIGSTLLVYEELLDRYIGYLMIYGNGNETVTIKTFNHATGAEHIVTNPSFQFAQNAMMGTPVEPYIINLFQTTVGITQSTSEKVSVHPNPARSELFINHPWNSIDHVEVLDITGRVLIRHKDFAKKSVNISNLASGIYMLRVISRDDVIIIKFVKEN